MTTKPNQPESQTPRTDAFKDEWNAKEIHLFECEQHIQAAVEFARQLERDLSEAKAALLKEREWKEVAGVRKDQPPLPPEVEEAIAELKTFSFFGQLSSKSKDAILNYLKRTR